VNASNQLRNSCPAQRNLANEAWDDLPIFRWCVRRHTHPAPPTHASAVTQSNASFPATTELIQTYPLTPALQLLAQCPDLLFLLLPKPKHRLSFVLDPALFVGLLFVY
jgi:hypothetical protein